MVLEVLDIGTTIKEKVEHVTSTLNKRRRTSSSTVDNVQDSAVDTEDEEDEEKNASTHFLSTQENKLFELQQHFVRHVNTLPVFGFHSVKFGLDIFKSYLILLLVNEKEIEPTVIKKSEPFCIFQVRKQSVPRNDEFHWWCNYP